MSSTSSLVYMQQYLTRYGITAYTILGSIGLLINIAIFSQSTYRQNPCSLYITIMSVCALVGLHVSVVPVIYALDHPNPLNSSLLACRLQFYFRHAINQMMRTFFVLACFDRYAISSSQVRIRSFSQYKITIRIIPSVIIFWLLLSIFPTVQYSIVNDICGTISGIPSFIVSIYVTLVIGIFPLLCMITFSTLIIINLKQMRARIQPIANTELAINRLRKRDRDMIKMLLIEVISYTITTVPVTVILIYRSAIQTIIKANEQIEIVSFINYLTFPFLLNINNSLNFWIYISVSQTFRSEFKKLIIKCYEFIINNEVRIRDTNPTHV